MNFDPSQYKLILENFAKHGPEALANHFTDQLQLPTTVKDVKQAAGDLRKKTQRKIDQLKKDGHVEQADALQARLDLAIPSRRRPANKAMDSAVDEFMAPPMPSDPAPSVPVEEEHGTD
jgi:hypothetical protein